MKSIGHMSFSPSVIKPTIAVLTSIQRAHYVTLGFMGLQQNFYIVKTKIFPDHENSEL